MRRPYGRCRATEKETIYCELLEIQYRLAELAEKIEKRQGLP
jgi:hypothetical protein